MVLKTSLIALIVFALGNIKSLSSTEYIDRLCVKSYNEGMNQVIRNTDQLGLALRNIRVADGLVQMDLAAQTHLRQATISGIENGDDGTKLKTLFKILNALDLEIVIQKRTTISQSDYLRILNDEEKD